MRRSDVPRHEAEQFRRESPYHEDDTLYHNRRAQHHPEVLQGMHPIASADHYAAYHERQVAKDAAKRRYGHVKREEERKLERASELERDYYRATSDSTGILPRGHYNLAPLAGAVGNRELECARSRADAYTKFPYMYPSIKNKQEHYAFIQSHYQDSAEAYDEQELHARLSSSRPPRSARDLFGNEPRSGHQAYHEPFPPSIPPPGYYSTTRGREASSSGDEWHEVKKPSHNRKAR